MTTAILAPDPLHDDRHDDWCNPAECEPGDTFEHDGATYGIDAIHARTVAAFDALHKNINDRPVAVRLVRERCGSDNHYVLHVGDVTVRLTAVQVATLRVLA